MVRVGHLRTAGAVSTSERLWQYTVWDRMASRPNIGHLRMITTDWERVEKLVAGDYWRFVITVEGIDV